MMFHYRRDYLVLPPCLAHDKKKKEGNVFFLCKEGSLIF